MVMVISSATSKKRKRNTRSLNLNFSKYRPSLIKTRCFLCAVNYFSISPCRVQTPTNPNDYKKLPELSINIQRAQPRSDFLSHLYLYKCNTNNKYNVEQYYVTPLMLILSINNDRTAN